jgi:hypothetical protein
MALCFVIYIAPMQLILLPSSALPLLLVRRLLLLLGLPMVLLRPLLPGLWSWCQVFNVAVTATVI